MALFDFLFVPLVIDTSGGTRVGDGLLKVDPDASAASFADWWRLWNIRDDELARLMDGVSKSGVLAMTAPSAQ